MKKRPYLPPKATEVDPKQAETIIKDRTKCENSEAKRIVESLLKERRQTDYQAAS